MQVDWITTIAQIINFLVLVYLLKRFLYRPIVGRGQPAGGPGAAAYR
jgi:hypothetical protein